MQLTRLLALKVNSLIMLNNIFLNNYKSKEFPDFFQKPCKTEEICSCKDCLLDSEEIFKSAFIDKYIPPSMLSVALIEPADAQTYPYGTLYLCKAFSALIQEINSRKVSEKLHELYFRILIPLVRVIDQLLNTVLAGYLREKYLADNSITIASLAEEQGVELNIPIEIPYTIFNDFAQEIICSYRRRDWALAPSQILYSLEIKELMKTEPETLVKLLQYSLKTFGAKFNAGTDKEATKQYTKLLLDTSMEDAGELLKKIIKLMASVAPYIEKEYCVKHATQIAKAMSTDYAEMLGGINVN